MTENTDMGEVWGTCIHCCWKKKSASLEIIMDASPKAEKEIFFDKIALLLETINPATEKFVHLCLKKVYLL